MRTSIDTAPKRSRLSPRRNPYWYSVAGGRGGVSLGYRRVLKGAGPWVAKINVAGRRIEERIGTADDDGSGEEGTSFGSAVAVALEWGKRQLAIVEAAALSGAASKAPTVRSAVDSYVATLAKRSAAAAAITRGRLTKHVLSDAAFSATHLSKLRASSIEDWRSRLPARQEGKETDGIGPSTVNRLLTDLRAALNATAERKRRELPPHLMLEIKVGTRRVPVETVTSMQLLTDAEVRRLVVAAHEVDIDGDFGRLLLLAAATGARFSQLAKMVVGDVQPSQSRVMVPGSRKGRSARARPRVAVPVGLDVIERLKPALAGRKTDQPLLERWEFRRAGGLNWQRSARRGWGPASEIAKPWAATVAKARLPPDTVMYALRHSSIVRGLRSGLPVRLVAALHDTSSAMIEAHYSAYIVDATEELARRAALTF